MFSNDEVDPWSGAILVQGVGAAATAVENALEDVTPRRQPTYPMAFVVCDPDSEQSVTSATQLANRLQEQETFTVGVALGPCDEFFSDAVDLLIRVPASDAAAVLRPIIGATAGGSLLPFDVTDLRWHFQSGGEAIADRQYGITSLEDLGPAIDASIRALRSRGALTDEGDWLVCVLQHGPAFGVGKSTSVATAICKEHPPQLMLFGTFWDTNYGEEAELISLARVCGGE